ncbi:MAG TPA: winged helix-turn-helix domain-containing protein [Pyrinomonadaceae bacterium]|nr:winged helix-turn-helix domain-containing protein [Pyrinomonadaceae bacterium]
MARRIELNPHLTTEELRQRYRSCQKPQEKVRWHALYLISKGVVAADAARRMGRSSSWITSLTRRYNRDTKAVARKQSTRPSHRAKVDAKLGKELDKALRCVAPDGGLWTAPKVAAWIAEKSGREVHQTTAWRAMRRLGFSLQVPRPANKRRASIEAQAEFKKR